MDKEKVKKPKKKKKKSTAKAEKRRFNFVLAGEVAGVFVIALALFGVWAWYPGVESGVVGSELREEITSMFGRAGSILFLIWVLVLGLSMIFRFQKPKLNRLIIDSLILFIFFETYVHLIATFKVPWTEIRSPEYLKSYGGWIGAVIVFLQRALVENVGSMIFTSFLLVILVVLRLRIPPSRVVSAAADRSMIIGGKMKHGGGRIFAAGWRRWKAKADIRAQRKLKAAEEKALKAQAENDEQIIISPTAQALTAVDAPAGSNDLTGLESQLSLELKGDENPACAEPENPAPEYDALRRLFADVAPDSIEEKPTREEKKKPEKPVRAAVPAQAQAPPEGQKAPFQLPPIEILKPPLPTSGGSESENQTRVLQKTLDDFAVPARIVHLERGPNVTRYELQLEPGVKVNRILSLHDDIALALAAKAIRIEAPIPGKSAIGIEVPNKVKDMVVIRELFESDAFQRAGSLLTVALGKDVSGASIVADLSKMPHMLVAGATGSGKSVCINCILNSILYKASPEEVRFILIDPKRVELTSYERLPHLLTPVVKEVKQAAGALKWAVEEMDVRYRLFAQKGFRNIEGYNQKAPIEERMYRVVIVVDELADLMMTATASQNVEYLICRIAQLARATGIHLVIATQRPDVKVITGTIKANIPSRIAFAVASQIDSRTILDTVGAEKLLGSGDMLFMPRGRQPIRIQGAFISDKEIEDVVDFIARQREMEFLDEVLKPAEEDDPEAGDGKDDDKDEFFDDAVKIILSTGQASISMLQRKLKIGYNRAARLVDMMEEKGIVGPPDGSNPRQILVGEDYLAR